MNALGGAAPTGSWRLIEPHDTAFLYELVAANDPRWWRFSRHGLDPNLVVTIAGTTSAGAVVHDGLGRPVACALLADAGEAGTGTFEYFALADEVALALARHHAPALVRAAFDGAPIRRLYHERFERDPDVLGSLAAIFEPEVVFPEFALVDGRFETRVTSVVTREQLDAWNDGAGTR
jgi:hypothetical protein